MSKNIAIILAGGSGSRLGNSTPKQFLRVAGKPVIAHSIDVFERCAEIDEIGIVSRADYIDEVKQIVAQYGYKKVTQILSGGQERYDSSMAAINAYTQDDDRLLFHDAVRPLVTERIIHDCVQALSTYNAVDVAVPTTDTIIEVDDHNHILHTPNRAQLRNVQTPQCFKRSTIARAYQLALADPHFMATDDCGVVRHYLPQEPIFVVNGEPFNIKLTYAEDLLLLETLLNR
ncbi:MAG: 2-C-methyl-D-erythritol 4-phosphate cytidylyltransferase [Paludibacteraceae bacterium]|nr:2-C-methyl-D-erythritol 4-phosphate cytidylyltransferase [Paludibacteraceae bacterium]